MSVLGNDALGHWAIGHAPDSANTATLTAAGGAYTVTSFPVSFQISENIAAASLAIAGVATSFTIKTPFAVGAFTWSPRPASFTVAENAAPYAASITGFPVNEIILEAEGRAAFTVTGNDAKLSRTGFDYEFQQGGIGHYLLEMQRAKQLAAITRKIPPPVDRRTAPTFRPAPRPPAAPIALAVDMAAIQKQRMDEAAAAARVAKKRRDEEAILLLAS